MILYLILILVSFVLGFILGRKFAIKQSFKVFKEFLKFAFPNVKEANQVYGRFVKYMKQKEAVAAARFRHRLAQFKNREYNGKV